MKNRPKRAKHSLLLFPSKWQHSAAAWIFFKIRWIRKIRGAFFFSSFFKLAHIIQPMLTPSAKINFTGHRP